MGLAPIEWVRWQIRSGLDIAKVSQVRHVVL